MAADQPPASYPSLAGKTVFVSGGGSGIGAAIVSRFAEQGCRVAFCDIDDEVLARRWSRGWRRARPLSPLRLARHRRAARDARRRRRGVRTDRRARQQRGARRSAQDRRRDARVLGRALRGQSAPSFLRDPGRGARRWRRRAAASIINMGSVSWMRATPGMVAYTAAKAAINGLTRTMARELGPQNIRVNSVVPGATMTERQRKLWFNPEAEQAIIDSQCLKFRLRRTTWRDRWCSWPPTRRAA